MHADISASVVLAPSITIALNQIINGLGLDSKSTVYLSPYEHNAVARPLHYVEKHIGIRIKQIPINENTLEIDIDKLKYEFSKDRPTAVFCTNVSNVTGYVLPVEEIFEVSKSYGALNVLDSAQSLGLIATDVRNLKVDIIAFAGHKSLYGPFGIGGFINVSGIKLKEFIVGGTGSNSLNLDIGNIAGGLARLVRYYMSDILWAYALVFALYLAVGSNAARVKTAFVIAVVFSAVMEVIQLSPVIPGTFDVIDILVEATAEAIAALIIKKQYEEASNI